MNKLNIFKNNRRKFLFFTIILFLIIVVSLSLFVFAEEDFDTNLKVQHPDFEFSNQRILIWNITQTGAEIEIEIEWEKKDDTTTKFCLKLKDKTNYINDVSGNISQIPVIKLNLINDFEISIDSFDFSGEELEIEECFEVTYNLLVKGMKFKIGFASVIFETVETANSVGKDASIAMDSNGVIHIVHNEDIDDDVRYCNNTDGSWSCVAVYTLNQAGLENSIAIDSSNVVHITTKEYTNYNLVYCNNTGGSWSCEAIDNESNMGSGSSIAIDSNDVIHITHINTTGSDSLRYCNNTGGSWSCDTIYSLTEITGQTSIAIDSSNVVHVSFTDEAGNDELYYGNNTGGSWSFVSVDSSDIQVGWQSSIAIDSNDIVHISSRDVINDFIRYCNNTGGSWSCDSIDSGGEETSIAIDSVNNPHIIHNNGAVTRHCSINITNDWECQDVYTDSLNSNRRDRGIIIKKGRISTSSTFDFSAHTPIYINTERDLGYAKIDISKVYSTLSSPSNNSRHNNLTIDFFCNSSHTLDVLKNTTLWVYNSTDIVNNTKNKSITGSTNSSNFTIILPNDDTYEWNCYVCDTNNECNFSASNYTLTIDSTFPVISILYPANNSNHSSNTIEINYSVSDTNLEDCWYSNDTYSYNYTLTSCANVTGVTWAEGQHNVTIWTNDTTNNQNSSSVTFTIDTIAPSITIDHPKAQVYSYNESLSFNYTIIDATIGLDTCWYYIFNSSDDYEIPNATITCNQNMTFNVSVGDTYTLTLHSNDTLNNENSDSVTFSVSLEAPAIVLDYPLNNQSFNNGTNIYFNFTAMDINGLDTCKLWGDWTGTWHNNYTWAQPTNNTQNFTVVNLTDVTAIWNVWCNDTSNKGGWALSNFTITIDTIYPNITINFITTTAGSQTISFNSTEQDINLGSCKYSIYNSSAGIDGTNENVSYTCGVWQTHSATVSTYATYNLTIYANDSAGNENTTTDSFTTSPAPVTPPGGGGGVTVIVLGEPGWIVSTEGEGEKYQINMLQGSSKRRDLYFENIGEEELEIVLSCKEINEESTFCEQIEFDTTNFTLPLIKELKTSVGFTITIPPDYKKGDYFVNLIGTDDLGGQGVITLEVNLETFGFVMEIATKITSNKLFGNVPIPYVIIVILIWITMGVSIYFIGMKPKKVTWGGGFATIIGFVIGLFSLLII